jgi:hypothetical protein
MKYGVLLSLVVLLSFATIPSWAAWTEYGDEDVLGTETYASDPKAGSTLEGLAPGAVTFSSLVTGHGWGFSPSAGEYAGTDQIYVGSNQTGNHDGYSGAQERKSGPQFISLDYNSLVSTGDVIYTFTLGIAADDFQYIPFGQPYVAKVNDIVNTDLTDILNGFDQTGPVVQFFTFGIDPITLDPSNILTLSVDQEGDGGDGWAIDFLTVGVTTSPQAVPEPATILSFGIPMLMIGLGKLKQIRK